MTIYRDLRNGFTVERVKAIAAQLAGKKESIPALTIGSIDGSTVVRQAASYAGKRFLKNEPKIGLTGAELSAARDRINSNLGADYQSITPPS